MNERFGEELTLDEILTVEEKAEDQFIRSAPGENFGPELTLQQALDILYQTALPPRATFWDQHRPMIQEALHNLDSTIEIEDYHFTIEYFARIKSVRKFDFHVPMIYTPFSPNGKATDDSEGSSSNSGATGSPSDSDV